MNRICHVLGVILPMLTLLACTPEAPETSAAGGQQEPAPATTVPGDRSPEQRLSSGERIYRVHCAACHQADGQGLAGTFPPLAGSDYLERGHGDLIRVVLQGVRGPVAVNGVEYDGVMPNLSYLSDSEVADVLSYILNAWGNSGGVIEPGQVAAARAE